MLFIGYWSALELWRSVRGMGVRTTAAIMSSRRERWHTGMSLRAKEADLERLSKNYELLFPLHVMVSHRKYRRKSNGMLQCHLCSGGMPQAEFIEIEDGVYLSSPEFCFMQMSSVLDTINLIRLAYELASTFAYDSNRRHVSSIPLASIESLLKANEKTGGLGNKNRMCSALRYAKGGAASAPEIELAMKLTLPYRWGGLNVGNVVLNPAIEISAKSREICGKSFCRPDVYCPDIRYDLEYQSKAFHSMPDEMTQDERRKLALAHDGVKVRDVSLEDLSSRESLMAYATEIANLRGDWVRIRSKNFERAQSDLFDRLCTGALLSRNAQMRNTPAPSFLSEKL